MRAFRFAFGIVAVFSLSEPFQTLNAADWATVIKPVEKQVLRLESLSDASESGPSVCSGVVLNEQTGYLLTAAHCIPLGEKSSYSLTVSRRHAELVKVNRLLDLAVVKFRVKGEHQMVLAEETPPRGTEVAVVGFMLASKEMRAQYGHVASPKSEDGALVIDGVTLPGDSGGAVIDSAGHLIGMTNQFYRGTAVGLAVRVEELDDFVDAYLPKKP